MLGKLPALAADAVVIDLEDGVAPPEKSESREHLRSAAARRALDEGPPWSLRVNACNSPWHEDDLRLAGELRPPRVVLAKAESVDRVRSLARSCSGWGGRVGLMIETARGLGHARELAGADPAVDLLIYGSADYRLTIGARPDPGREWERHALHEILLAARMHDCSAVDSVFFHFRDAEGLRREARIARDLGYDGKSCIHPSQVSTIHEVFTSTAEEIAWARSVLRVWAEQGGDRKGIVVLDGEMIEALHLRVAEKILGQAESAGGE
jgi:citrate lyase subunit beta/citryl-CoA lyase